MKRIQRKRTKGWRMPENCKYVGRPTKWGNPFDVREVGREEAVRRYEECLLNNAMCYYYFDEIVAENEFKRFERMALSIKELMGYDLACFCKEGEVCHADVLIKMANKQ